MFLSTMFLRRFKLRFILFILLAIGSIYVLYNLFDGPFNKSSPNKIKNESNSNRITNILQWPWSKHDSKKCNDIEMITDVDVNAFNVYPSFNFKPTFKSYWNYTFEKRYQKLKEQNTRPLKVIVMPHSHNDPGWLNTFEGYYFTLTSHILQNMINKLEKYPDMSFIWTEISFFARWYDSLNQSDRLRVAKLLERGQLEMTTGGWVMTDEATVHYFAMIDQLIEGHQWLKSKFNVIPINGWSVDPFGHSSTMPYFLHKAGINHTVIQRVHFGWKEFLAARQQLDFFWSQAFDIESKVLCHMAPFDLYSIKHSCGPDPHICLYFDFRKVTDEYSESRSVKITPHNVKEKAEALLGQYERVGSLFPHNVVLIPLGDDFRYNNEIEWDQQYENYKMLMDFINSNPDYNANISFGTLKDYFDNVLNRTNSFPTLVGDFFAYGDIYADGRPSYWTGYYTTRPFMKHLSRQVEHWLRATEIIYTLSRNLNIKKPKLIKKLDEDYKYLTIAREALALFQHHDAITGTSKPLVMKDYGVQLHKGLRELRAIVSHACQFLLMEDPPISNFKMIMTSHLFSDEDSKEYDSPTIKIPVIVPPLEGKKIVLYNSLAQSTKQPIRIIVKTPHLKVTDPNGNFVASQINPVWNDSMEIASDVFELLFIANLPPLSLSTFFLELSEPTNADSHSVIYTFVADQLSTKPEDSIFDFPNAFQDTNIILESPSVEATFSKSSGLLLSVRNTRDGVENVLGESYGAYRSLPYHSGAYLFQPDPERPTVNITERFPILRLVKGPLLSELTAVYPGKFSITHRLYNSEEDLGEALGIECKFDLTHFTNKDVEMYLRFKSNIENKDVFYTDSNGFQMTKRATLPQLPIEANYYPVTSAFYIEDDQSRLSVLVSHAHGVSSINDGWIEVMLDRRMRFDDSRGLSEGIQDNKVTTASFWLLLEKKEYRSYSTVPNLSSLSQYFSHILNYPAIIMIADGKEQKQMKNEVLFLGQPFSLKDHIVNLRTLPLNNDFDKPSNESLLLLHNHDYTCQIKFPQQNSTSIEFLNLNLKRLQRTSLTGVRTVETLPSFSSISLKPMSLEAFKLLFV